jgi:GAF domain-containing protein
VPVESLKLALCVCNCVKTKKPAITNDVINDPRIRYPEWARKEKLKSYAGYPLVYKGEAIAVLGMFSEKKLSPADFEIVGVFCDQLAKELSSLFGAAEFLSVQ